MGQKINPLSFRLQYFKNWNSLWFYPHNHILFKHKLLEDYKLKIFLIDFFKSRNICVNNLIFSRKQFNILNIFISISYVYVKKKYKKKINKNKRFQRKNQKYLFFFSKRKKFFNEKKIKFTKKFIKIISLKKIYKNNSYLLLNILKLFKKLIFLFVLKKKNLMKLNFFFKKFNNFNKKVIILKLKEENLNLIYFLNLLYIYYIYNIKKKNLFFFLNRIIIILEILKKFNTVSKKFFLKKLKVILLFNSIKQHYLKVNHKLIRSIFYNYILKYQYNTIKISKFFFIKNFTSKFKKNFKKLKFHLNKNFITVVKLRFYLIFLTKTLFHLLNFYKLNWIILIEKSLNSVQYISLGTKKNLERNLRFNTYIEIATKSILKKTNLLNLNEFYLNKFKIYQLFNIRNILNIKKDINHYTYFYYFLVKYNLEILEKTNFNSYILFKNLKMKTMNSLLYLNLNNDKYKYILKYVIPNKIDLLLFIYKVFFNQFLVKKNRILFGIDFYLNKYFLKKFSQILRKKEIISFFLKKFFINKKNLMIINGYLMVCSGRIRNQRKKSKLFFYKGKLLRSSILVQFDYLNETAFTKNGSFGLKIYKSFEKINILKLKKKILKKFYKLNMY